MIDGKYYVDGECFCKCLSHAKDFDGNKTFGFAFSGNGSNSFNDFNSGLKLGLYYNF